jgi:hypothetical protein
VLFKLGVLGPESIVLELGTGVSGLVAMALESKIKKYIATDQDYVLKFLRQNLSGNFESIPGKGQFSSRKSKQSKSAVPSFSPHGNIQILPLDWETDQIYQDMLYGGGKRDPDVKNLGLDLVLACDCIFNEGLIEPLVSTCKELCALRSSTPLIADSTHSSPTVCLVALQLRTPDVLESWLRSFCQHFRVWRVPDEILSSRLSAKSGFVIFLGVLRSSCPTDS